MLSVIFSAAFGSPNLVASDRTLWSSRHSYRHNRTRQGLRLVYIPITPFLERCEAIFVIVIPLRISSGSLCSSKLVQNPEMVRFSLWPYKTRLVALLKLRSLHSSSSIPRTCEEIISSSSLQVSSLQEIFSSEPSSDFIHGTVIAMPHDTRLSALLDSDHYTRHSNPRNL